VSVNAGAVLVGFCDVVGADGDEAAVAHLHLVMELDQTLRLPPVFRTEASTAEDEDRGILSLQFGEFAAFRSVIGKLIVGKDGAWHHVGSHLKFSGSCSVYDGCGWVSEA
jgi:hypothetical protein